MYPKGSPKYNLVQTSARKSSLDVKKPSPKIRKTPPKAKKPRAQWNPALEKALVEILLEHNNLYHRGQNGWSSESWNRRAKIFHERYAHTNFTKVQIQEKQKELKSHYRILKDARKQSGAGWNYHTHMIEADPHLWHNMITSWSEISKFQNKSFPLYNLLGDLYDGHIAEGTYNFTSTVNPEVTQVESDVDPEAEREEPAFSIDLNRYDDDLQILDEQMDPAPRDAPPRDATQSDAGVDDVAQRGAAGKKPRKEPKIPKKREDAMVGMMEKYVEIKRKQAEEESAFLAVSINAQEFTISKCIVVLHKMQSIERSERAAAYKVFKIAENRETFLISAADDEESAAEWLRSEMAELPRGI